jgi:hypothetical protein
VRVESEAAEFTVLEGGTEVVSWQPSPETSAFERNGTLPETRSFLRPLRVVPAYAPSLADRRVRVRFHPR